MNRPFFLRPKYRRRDGRTYRPRTQSYSYTPLQVARAYGLPSQYDGTGVTIGIIELGGAFSLSDYQAYMKSLGFNDYATPACFGTQSDDPGGANVEVMLDAEVIGGIAPKAKIRIYFMPNTDTGIADGINQAVADGCNVISISWGADEASWAASDRQATDAALQNAIQKFVAVYVAAGDNGSSDGGNGNNADYPASSPYSIGCGGTSLILSSGVIQSETVWNDGSQGGATGGGQSAYYSTPAFQSLVNTSGKRGVPDVAGVADPNTGWMVRADGQDQVVGGTSAVAPMWAAIHALLVQMNGGVSFPWPAPLFYQNLSAFNDITSGNNGSFVAGPGYDFCTGLGSPNGPKLFALNYGGSSPTPTPTPPSPSPSPPPAPKPKPPVCFNRLERFMELPEGSILKGLKRVGPLARELLAD